ncbi:hypothetical protein Hypma_005552 [Hypsizygus marmoreus]|uniref:Uncharacterized protein n=1 Tax=Hypsizygus marmoreus TaxID=39966 RepID=A0A369K1M1_HYPMA|nr:hypothetical protein Hypma_005552 [Hypsizygus marmoreus]
MAALLPIPVAPPAQFFLLPQGSYGISYDISTRRTEDDLPDGWHAHRSNTYRQIIDILAIAAFTRDQYSDYRAVGVSALVTWQTMWQLRNIQPPMKLQSTILGLKMQFYHFAHLFNITQDMQLGGAGAPTLLGPVPANLVLQAPLHGNLAPAPVPLAAAPNPLPVHTRPSQNAGNAITWMR